jgi:hypothetical protein
VGTSKRSLVPFCKQKKIGTSWAGNRCKIHGFEGIENAPVKTIMTWIRLLLLPLVVGINSMLALPQQSSPSTQTSDFESLTKARLQAVAAEIRQDWDKSVLPVALVIDEAGTRDDRDHFWQDELRSCKEAHCTPIDFHAKLQPNIVLVTYSLIVASGAAERLVRCTDTYIVSDAMWKLISGFRSVVPNARKPRADVDAVTLQNYVGKYSDQSGQIYEVVLNDGRLSARRGGQATITELIPESPTKFYVIGDEGSTEFIKSKHGDVTGLVIRTKAGDQTLTRTN